MSRCATVVCSVSLLMASVGAAASAAHAQLSPIRHGRDLTARLVGPQAAGLASMGTYPGQTIRDDTVAPYLRRVASAATYDGLVVRGPHLLIEDASFSGPLDVYATAPLVLRGVTVRLSAMAYWGILSRAGAGPLHVLWSRITGPSEAGSRQAGVQRGLYLESAGARVYRSHITRTADGIQVHAPDAQIVETLVDDLTTWEGEHNDGIQLIGRGERMTVERSRIVNPHPQTSAILLQRGGHTITDSYLSGGGWTLYGGATPKPPDITTSRGLRINGNIFGQERAAKSGTFGPVADWDGSAAAGNVWRDNRFADGHPVETQSVKP